MALLGGETGYFAAFTWSSMGVRQSESVGDSLTACRAIHGADSRGLKSPVNREGWRVT